MYAKDGSLLRIRPVPPLFITSYDYKYNGKEYQDELALNVYDYGARNYDPSLGRWMNMDEKSEKFTSFSPYNYCVNNPVRIIDPDGKAPSDIIGLFNKSTGQLTVIDKDHYDAKLPTIYVNSSQYKMGGIRDDKGNLTTNQVLVLDNFFTGGESENGNVTRDPDRPQQKPIPNGIFDVLDNDADTKHEGWFRLDRVDKERFNDKDDATGRSGFRLHLGTESWGCITGDKSKDSRT
jgi:RHS repeat-associated protein